MIIVSTNALILIVVTLETIMQGIAPIIANIVNIQMEQGGMERKRVRTHGVIVTSPLGTVNDPVRIARNQRNPVCAVPYVVNHSLVIATIHHLRNRN